MAAATTDTCEKRRLAIRATVHSGQLVHESVHERPPTIATDATYASARANVSKSEQVCPAGNSSTDQEVGGSNPSGRAFGGTQNHWAPAASRNVARSVIWPLVRSWSAGGPKRIHRFGYGVELVIQEMAVQIEGHGRRLVSKHLLYDFDVGAAGDGKRCGCVTQTRVIQADRRPARIASGWSLSWPGVRHARRVGASRVAQ